MEIINSKISKIGGSHYLYIPSEYIKVFKLAGNKYELFVLDNGNSLKFEKIEEEPIEEEIIKEDLKEELYN